MVAGIGAVHPHLGAAATSAPAEGRPVGVRPAVGAAVGPAGAGCESDVPAKDRDSATGRATATAPSTEPATILLRLRRAAIRPASSRSSGAGSGGP